MYRIKATDLYPSISTDTLGLRDFVKKLESKNYLQQQPSETIYHYTDAAGLLGMVENKNLWCTDIKYMNDARGYGKYCIGFNCEKPFRTDIHANLPSEWPKARLRKVLYYKKNKRKLL